MRQLVMLLVLIALSIAGASAVNVSSSNPDTMNLFNGFVAEDKAVAQLAFDYNASQMMLASGMYPDAVELQSMLMARDVTLNMAALRNDENYGLIKIGSTPGTFSGMGHYHSGTDYFVQP
jgi:hypothetical protein